MVKGNSSVTGPEYTPGGGTNTEFGSALSTRSCREGWGAALQTSGSARNSIATVKECSLVGQVESSVTFRATVRVRIKARFAGNGPSLGKKRNTESHSHSGSRRAAPQASWAVLQPLERACHSLRTAPCPQCLWRG